MKHLIIAGVLSLALCAPAFAADAPPPPKPTVESLTAELATVKADNALLKAIVAALQAQRNAQADAAALVQAQAQVALAAPK